MSTSKSKSRNRKAQRRQEQQRQRLISLVIAMIVVVAVIAAAVIISNQPLPAPVEAASADRYAEVAQSFTDDGLPQLGALDAPVTIHDYSSFTCPHCSTFHDNQFVDLLNNEIPGGQVRFVYVPVVRNDADAAANRAAFCAADQGRFWEMHDALFLWLNQFGANAAFVNSRFVSAAGDLGLNADEFSACLGAPETQARVDSAQQIWLDLLARDNTITGTPTLTFNGIPVFGSGAIGINDIRQQIAELSG